MKTKTPDPSALAFDLFAAPVDNPVPSPAPQAAAPDALLLRPALEVFNDCPHGPTEASLAVEWQTARTAFGHAVKAAGRNEEILTYINLVAIPGTLDGRKLTRLANELLGRPASLKPTPSIQDWKDAAGAVGKTAKAAAN